MEDQLAQAEAMEFETVRELERYIARHQSQAHQDDPAKELACPTCAVLEMKLVEMQWLDAIPAALCA